MNELQDAVREWMKGVVEALQPLLDDPEVQRYINDPWQVGYEVDLNDPEGAEEWDVFI